MDPALDRPSVTFLIQLYCDPSGSRPTAGEVLQALKNHLLLVREVVMKSGGKPAPDEECYRMADLYLPNQANEQQRRDLAAYIQAEIAAWIRTEEKDGRL